MPLKVGDRARVFLESNFWRSSGWFEGTVLRIDPYSSHRAFHWLELDTEVEPMTGGKTRVVSVLNPKHIMQI
jgi:hypothetical protein